MTTRICFIGNSHLAALSEAWSRDPAQWPGLQASFVGAHKDLLLQTEVRDGRLIPATDDARQSFGKISGVSDVVLDHHDVFVIVGSGVALATALMIYRDARWVGLPSLAQCSDLATMPEQLISRPAAMASMTAALDNRLGLRLIRHLRHGTKRPIYLTSQPRVSQIILQSPQPVTRLHNIALRNGDNQALSAAFDAAAAAVLTNAGATFIPQPAETIARDLFTAQAYVKGAHRLAATMGLPQAKDDVKHANAIYGALVLDQIAAAVYPT